MNQQHHKPSLDDRDYEYIQALSAAVLMSTPRKLRFVLYFWIGAIVIFVIWASLAEVDEIARGNGQVVASAHNKMIQNLEGGIVEDIMVREGEIVKANQPLIKINNEKSASSYQANELEGLALQAMLLRLKAEAQGIDFEPNGGSEALRPYLENEYALFESNRANLRAKINGLRDRLFQRKQELFEAKSNKKHLKLSLDMIQEELAMTEPMVERGVKSQVDFLKIQRDANDAESKYQATLLSIPRLDAAVQETQRQIDEAEFLFRADAQKQYNETVMKFNTARSEGMALSDQVNRTIVRSPMDGIVQRLFVHTIGGVIKPADNLIEIVPRFEKLVVEVKIKPSDIAFIYPSQRAIVKFSAYDFAIYGGLEGKVVSISPDTETNEKEETFYTVRIETTKGYLVRQGKKLAIIPGMTVSADIVTGRKTVLDYILKPILKTKQHMLTER